MIPRRQGNYFGICAKKPVFLRKRFRVLCIETAINKRIFVHRILFFIAFSFACSVVFAGDFANAKKKFVDIPKSQDSPLENWIEPYDETYLPYHVCREPQSLQVVEIKEKVDSYWEHAEGIIALLS